MKKNMHWSRFAGVASVALLAFAAMGNTDGCGPIDPPPETEDQCTVPQDCVGLPHVMCLGDWQCVAGACRWECGAPEPECTTAADCDGQPIPYKCLGSWACAEGACDYRCGVLPTKCTADADCPTGQHCELTPVCPGCSESEPPCLMPCSLEGTCVADTQPTCVTGGCSGELCMPAGSDLASPCWYLDWFACLQYSQCGNFGQGGACGWAETPDFLACLDSLTCDTDSDCAPGYFCALPPLADPATGVPYVQGGRCVKKDDPVVGCRSNEQCPKGQHCSVSDGECGTDPTCPACDVCYGKCVDDPVVIECGPDVACPVGMACQEQSDCPSCVYEYPACKMACQVKYVCVPVEPVGCTSDADCGPDQFCAIPPCDPAMNCGADASGAPMPNCLCQGTCQPRQDPGRCTTDADCPQGQRCYWTGMCPMCSCEAGNSDCYCPPCEPEGFCGPACDPAVPEKCGNGVDDDCDGLVDEDCLPPNPCMGDAECAGYEYCDYVGAVYDEAGNLSCCPPNARCTADIPPCGMGQCRLRDGYCWTDADCGYGQRCDGAIICPPGAACFVADRPGQCVGDRRECQGNEDCPRGYVCQWDYGCPPCDCPADDPTCACPMCMPAANGWCVPGGCTDLDGDGFCAEQDCDDWNAAVFPGAYDGCDGLDNDCDGLVDEDCRPGCFSDADCGPFETCLWTPGADPSGEMACCPPNAFCDGTLPPCGQGICVLQPGLCWTDADCATGQRCEGAQVCPDGSACFAPDSPGKCIDIAPPPASCTSDRDCLEGTFCAIAMTYPLTCCPPGEICIMIYPPCEGTCQLQAGRCWSDGDCGWGQACEGERVCPPGALCILPDAPGKCVDSTQPTACKDGTECPAGQACVEQTVCPDCYYQDPACLMPCWTESVCRATCEADSDCANGEYCNVTRCGEARCLGPYFCEPLYGI